MKVQPVGIAVASLIACGASAQAPSRQPASATPVGVWRGTSVCLVRPSSCNDESVVYRITQTTVDSVAFDALKIVNGKEEDMGVLGCRLVPRTGQLTCAIPRGVWYFTVRGDSLVGELRLPDNTRFRDVRTIRSQ